MHTKYVARIIMFRCICYWSKLMKSFQNFRQFGLNFLRLFVVSWFISILVQKPDKERKKYSKSVAFFAFKSHGNNGEK